MIVRICLGEERERVGYPKWFKRYLSGIAHKRLYFLTGEGFTPRDARTAWDDLTALLCLSLIQEKLTSFDEDRPVQAFLCSYVGKFRGARQVGVLSVIEHLLRNYQILESYRALRRYISRTIDGLVKAQRHQESRQTPLRPAGPESAQLIPAAADRLGMPRQTLYHLVKHGHVRTETSHRSGLMIPNAEIGRIEAVYGRRRLRLRFIRWWAQRKDIQGRSARKWVERLERNGQSIEHIICQYPAFLECFRDVDDGNSSLLCGDHV
jgi:hypothetical protein